MVRSRLHSESPGNGTKTRRLRPCREVDEWLTWATPTCLPGRSSASTYSKSFPCIRIGNGRRILSTGALRARCRLVGPRDGATGTAAHEHGFENRKRFADPQVQAQTFSHRVQRRLPLGNACKGQIAGATQNRGVSVTRRSNPKPCPLIPS